MEKKLGYHFGRNLLGVSFDAPSAYAQEREVDEASLIFETHRAFFLRDPAQQAQALNGVIEAGVDPQSCLALALRYDIAQAALWLVDQRHIQAADLLSGIYQGKDHASPRVIQGLADRADLLPRPQAEDEQSNALFDFLEAKRFGDAYTLMQRWRYKPLPSDFLDRSLLNLSLAMVGMADASDTRSDELGLGHIEGMWKSLVKSKANPYRQWSLDDKWDEKLYSQEATRWAPDAGFVDRVPDPVGSPASLLLVACHVLRRKMVSGSYLPHAKLSYYWDSMGKDLDPSLIPRDGWNRGPWSLIHSSHASVGNEDEAVAPLLSDWLTAKQLPPSQDGWPMWEMALGLAAARNYRLLNHLADHHPESLAPGSIEDLSAVFKRFPRLCGPGNGKEPLRQMSDWWEAGHALRWGEVALPAELKKAWIEQVSRMAQLFDDDTPEKREDASLFASTLLAPVIASRSPMRL